MNRDQPKQSPLSLPNSAVLTHLGAGVGNIVLATPLLLALRELGFTVDVWLTADYPPTIDLLRPWNVVRQVFGMGGTQPSFNGYAHIIPAIPPFYWARFAPFLARAANLLARPSPSLFYDSEQEFYLWFARALGYPTGRAPCYALPISPDNSFGLTPRTLVLAPGCKTAEMAAKRWPHFQQLAEAFADVALVGTPDDLRDYGGREFKFPSHVRSFVGRLTLRQTAELLASAGVVVANDSGLGHVAAAVGTPTILLFGPTPDKSLGPFPANVTVLRRGLPCEPCWFGSRFKACARGITCLRELTVEGVIAAIEQEGLNRVSASARQANKPSGELLQTHSSILHSMEPAYVEAT